jgi:AraC-like DNA-binding protein
MQVPQCPSVQELGASIPAANAACNSVSPAAISPDDLSRFVGISRRQLERLFQQHLQCTPTRYYLNLRLNRARLLLLQTAKSITDISLACGFVSAPHFSKCYRDLFGFPPRAERRGKRIVGDIKDDSVANPSLHAGG